MTQTLTTERLREIASSPSFSANPLSHEVKHMARELLANREAHPVVWGSPKTVGQLIGQLQTLDPAMETTALLRMPADILDGNAVKQVPISISFERLEGHWLAPYKGDGRKVLAFWAKADHREETDRGELFTAPPAPAVPGAAKVGEMPFLGSSEPVYVKGWNACRAAMLAQPVSQGCTLNSPETPDGWVACSERMPPVNDVVITSNNDSVSVCLSEASAKYRYFTSIVSGREVDVTHWMPLPAAPEGGSDPDTRR